MSLFRLGFSSGGRSLFAVGSSAILFHCNFPRMMMPKAKAKGIKGNYTEEDVLNALVAIKERGFSIRKASMHYRIPRTTLSDKIHHVYTEGKSKPGPNPALRNDQEQRLIQWITYMASIGYGMTKKEIPLIVKSLLDGAGQVHSQFENNLPSISWVYRLLERFPEVSSRVPEHIGRQRTFKSKGDIISWFDGLSCHLQEEHGITATEFFTLEMGDRIYNCDKTGFPLAGKTSKLRILTTKGAKNIYSVSSDTREQITVLGCVSASGKTCVPLVIYPGERIRFNFQQIDPSEFHFGHSSNGWLTAECFYEWITNCFYPSIKDDVQFPIILLLDSHSTRINLHLAEFCIAKKIILYCFPSHVSHAMQPLDLSVYGPMKTYWNEELRKFSVENMDETMTKAKFLPIFKRAWDRAIKKDNIIAGFRKAGLVPFNYEAIDYSRLLCFDPVEGKVELGFGEKLGLRRALAVVEKNMPKETLQSFRKALEEDNEFESSHDEQPNYRMCLWNIYKDLHQSLLGKEVDSNPNKTNYRKPENALDSARDVPIIQFRLRPNVSSNFAENFLLASQPSTVYDFTATDIDGKDVSLEKYRGQVLLIVNVASK